MKKILAITPHLSTGGCPQYLLKKIQTFGKDFEFYVVEYSFLSAAYVVQRNAIRNLLPEERFFSLEENKEQLLQIIEKTKPDIIHFEEIPETFCDIEILRSIYLKENRNYFIIETTHSSYSKPEDKVFLPDKFVFVCEYSKNKFESLEIDSEIWEYPIEKIERPNRKESLKKLGLNPAKIHILNVGLFTPGKNQGELIDIARMNPEIQFHFVGNLASNFKHYWSPLIDNLPENCIIWGEREDTFNFMQACDLFYFSSILELNPLVIKEALSAQIPILMYNLPVYLDKYSENETLKFLKSSLVENSELVHKMLNISDEPQKYKVKLSHIVSELFSEIEQTSMKSVSSLSQIADYTIYYNPVAKSLPSDKPLFENLNLKPGHFGCFNAFKRAIFDCEESYDFLIICERDCILEKTVSEFKEKLNSTFTFMLKNNVTYVSFGDIVDLDRGYLQSNLIKDHGFIFETDKIIGLQFIILSRQGINFLRKMFNKYEWYGMDIWLNEVYERENMKKAILKERFTTQLDGFSLIDNIFKKFKQNVQ